VCGQPDRLGNAAEADIEDLNATTAGYQVAGHDT
jgi:hypothetical protein